MIRLTRVTGVNGETASAASALCEPAVSIRRAPSIRSNRHEIRCPRRDRAGNL